MNQLLREYLTNKTINNRNRLINANMGLIYQHVRMIKGNHEEHELVNHLMPQMIKAIETFDPAYGTELSTWVHMHLKNRLFIKVKRDSRHNHKPLPPDIVDDREEYIELPDIINNQHLLNEQQRMILMLMMKGLDGVQIGQMLNWSKAYINQIKKEIARILKPVIFCEG